MTELDQSASLRTEASIARQEARKIDDPVLAQIMNTLATSFEVRAMIYERWPADQFKR